MGRKIASGIHWLQDEYEADVGEPPPDWHDPANDLHSAVNAYLLVDKKSLLFDTQSPANTEETIETVREALDGADLDYVAISHAEAPHAGNTTALVDAFPEAEVLAPAEGDLHDLYYLGEATRVQPGVTLDLGTKTVEFVDAPFIDTGMHMWMFERRSRTLFTVDWMAFPHDETECLQFVDEMSRPPSEIAEMMWLSNGLIFPWFEYVDPARVEAVVEYFIERFNPEILAPAHGQVIREMSEQYLDLMVDVMRRHSRGDIPHLVS